MHRRPHYALLALIALASGCPDPALPIPRAVPRAGVLPLTAPPAESLVYDATVHLPPDAPVAMELRFEQSLAGRPRLVAAGAPAPDHRPYLMTDEDAARWVFPEPPSRGPRRTLSIPHLDEHEPDVEFAEEVQWSTTSRATVRRLDFTRAGRIQQTPVRQRGWGMYDTSRGHYRELHFVLLRDGDVPSSDRLVARVVLELDASASRRRTERLEELRAVHSLGVDEYAEYATRHSADDEIRGIEEALRQVDADLQDAGLWFHAHANPGPLWRALLTQPDGEIPDYLIWVLVVGPLLDGETMDEEVVAIVAENLHRRDLRLLVTRLHDPRFQEQLETWAVDPAHAEDTALRRNARWALAELEHDARIDPESVRRAFDEPEVAMELVSRYLASNDDPRPLVPVLIDWLARAPRGSWEAEEVIALLERLTQREHGYDVRDWRAFVQRHAAESYEHWLLAGARREQTRSRLNAYAELSGFQDTPQTRAQLRRGLADPHPLVRFVAAEGLAGRADPSGAEILIGQLDAGDAWIRESAFMALAGLHRSTLGYDPSASEMERARAIGRWRAWAERLRRTVRGASGA